MGHIQAKTNNPTPEQLKKAKSRHTKLKSTLKTKKAAYDVEKKIAKAPAVLLLIKQAIASECPDETQQRLKPYLAKAERTAKGEFEVTPEEAMQGTKNKPMKKE